MTSLVGNIERFIEAKLSFYHDQFYEFELVERATNRIDFFSRSQKDAPRWENKSYFIVHNGQIYEIFSSAKVGPYPELGFSNLYDGYKSFRFEP